MDLMTISGLSVMQRLQDIDLSIRAGVVLGLIGPNGAGKSTLLHAIAGLLDSSGQIELDGQPIEQYSAEQRARLIALQPQFLESAWALSVHDIVSMGRLPWADSDQQIIEQAMRRTNVLGFAQRPVNQLSGGERARVWLARVLANQPRVLLVDEPIANLDIHYQQDVMQILRDYAQQGHAVIIALHDLSLAARYCDRLCLLEQTQLVSCGRVDQVLTEKLLQQVFKVEVFIDLAARPPVVLSR
ncbi:MAG: ABC transporter ATP-binding protein [Gammaproteobacteria bacterium]|nr:ABC transporter ATP-binding protein [Gammaproteobacteria bacterium]